MTNETKAKISRFFTYAVFAVWACASVYLLLSFLSPDGGLIGSLFNCISRSCTSKEIVLKGFILNAFVLTFTVYGLIAIPFFPFFFLNVDKKLHKIPRYIAYAICGIVAVIVFIVSIKWLISQDTSYFNAFNLTAVIVGLVYAIAAALVATLSFGVAIALFYPITRGEPELDWDLTILLGDDKPYEFYNYLRATFILSLALGALAGIAGIIACLIFGASLGVTFWVVAILVIIGVIMYIVTEFTGDDPIPGVGVLVFWKK